MDDLGKSSLATYAIFFCAIGIAILALGELSETIDDLFSHIVVLIFSALITFTAFVIGMFLTRGSEKRIMKRLDAIDANIADMKTSMDGMKKSMDGMACIMLKILNMMEDDRGLPRTTREDMEPKSASDNGDNR